jgi:sorting nexin-1/2
MTKLVKAEFARFERERVEEFKRVLEKHLEGAISRQKELLEAWEEYHEVLWKMVKKNDERA